ncbi:MAG: tetratricopeptide repeat protein, partial [Chitinophagales bacterium]
LHPFLSNNFFKVNIILPHQHLLMKKRLYPATLFFFCTLLLFARVAFCADQFPDSVQVKYSTAKHDTARVRILLEYSQQVQDSTALSYVNMATVLIDKNISGTLKKDFTKLKGDALSAIGLIHRNITGDFTIALENFTASLAAYEEADNTLAMTVPLSNLQDIYLMGGDIVNGKKILDKSIVIQKESGDTRGYISTLQNYSNYYAIQGNADSALVVLTIANNLAKQSGNKEAEAHVLFAMGTTWYNKGDMSKTLPFFYESIAAFEKSEHPEEKYQPLMGVGLVYAKLGAYQKAIGFYKPALKIATETNDLQVIGLVSLNMGIAYRASNQPDSAIGYLEQGLTASRQVGFTMYGIYSLVNLGQCMLEKKDTVAAMKYFRESVTENKTALLSEGFAESYYQIGNVFFLQHKTDSAMYYANLSMSNASTSQFAETLKPVVQLLSSIYERKENYQKAFEYYKSYIGYRDTIDNKKAFQSAVEKQFEYESEKKELLAKAEREKAAIALTAQKNKLLISSIAFVAILTLGGFLFYVNRKRKESVFRENLAESEMKALRAQMNPHFTFNSLNAIQQMVLSNENDNAFHYLDTYSKLTRKMLENSEKKFISVYDEIKFLELYLSVESLRFQHSFQYEIKVDESLSPHASKVPAMVIQPYVENAIKHGLLPKNENQQLLIHFKRNAADNELLEIVIEDNGVGRKNAAMKNMDGHQSMGMSITENRLRLLEGKKGNKVLVEDLVAADGSAAGTRVRIIISQNN